MAHPEGHSRFGGSAIERVIECSASAGLSQGTVDIQEDWTLEGIAAHKLVERCLSQNKDAWHYVGKKISGIKVDKEMSDAVQIYINAVRDTHPDRHQGNFWIERPFHARLLHEELWGKSDAVFLDVPNRTLHIWDYKHGAGIIINVVENPQEMHYACGTIEDLMLWVSVDWVVLHIVQPRGWHWDGPIREWKVSVEDLRVWMNLTMLPAIYRAEKEDPQIASGEHCRFCPVRAYACPQLEDDMDELEEMLEMIAQKGASKLSAKNVARYLDLRTLMNIVGKAADNTAFGLLNAGKKVPGYKLGAARVNRELKKGGETAAKKKFGKRAYTEPKLKSPAQIEAMAQGKEFTARWAFKPDGGNTVVKAADSRMPVNRDYSDMFDDLTEKHPKPKKKGK